MNAPGTQKVLESGSGSHPALALSLAIADYDRTLPLIHGQVRPDGIALRATPDFDIGDFCHKPVYERFDFAEMSLSWYVAARCRKEPLLAIPAFPLRMPILAYLFCRSDAPYTSPADLRGKKIATGQYRFTVNLWTRGIFQHDYGVSPEELHWVTRQPEGAGFTIPRGIEVSVIPERTPEQLLLDGEIDAMIGVVIPGSFLEGDPRIRRLFPDARAEMRKYVAQKGFMPITHAVVMSEPLARREPWIASSMVRAFEDAQRACDQLNLEPKRYSFGDGAFFIEEQLQAYGGSVYRHGLEPNRKVLETFVGYAFEQGYIPRKPDLDELFAPTPGLAGK